MTESEPHPITGQPIGLPVEATPAKRPDEVMLQGRYGYLEKLKAQHAAGLWSVFKGHDAVWTYISKDGPFASEAEFATFIAMRAAASDPFAYAIVDREAQPLGYLTLMEIRPEMRVIEVGHVLYSPALQKTLLATEAQYLIARYAFETLGYCRYEWKCNALNAASRRAALRYGFVFEGVLRAHMIGKGRNRDTAFYSMVEAEWPARKAALERWLAPKNFGAQGRQIESLSRLNGAEA